MDRSGRELAAWRRFLAGEDIGTSEAQRHALAGSLVGLNLTLEAALSLDTEDVRELAALTKGTLMGNGWVRLLDSLQLPPGKTARAVEPAIVAAAPAVVNDETEVEDIDDDDEADVDEAAGALVSRPCDEDYRPYLTTVFPCASAEWLGTMAEVLTGDQVGLTAKQAQSLSQVCAILQLDCGGAAPCARGAACVGSRAGSQRGMGCP